MVYIGIAEGIKGHRFMHIANNQIFTVTIALFDESLFPKCKTAVKHPTTHLNEPVTEQPPIQPRLTLDDDNKDPPFRFDCQFTPKSIPPPAMPQLPPITLAIPSVHHPPSPSS